MTTFLLALSPVAILVALGRFIAWRGYVGEPGWRGVERLAYLVLFPALIVQKLAAAPFDNASWSMVGALVFAQFCLAGLGLLSALSRNARPGTVGAVIQSNVRWNTFVGLSLAGALFGDEGVALMAVAAAGMIPVANALSVWALTRFGPGQSDPARLFGEMARNPLILACLLGGALNIAGLAPTGALLSTLQTLGDATIAIGLLTAGAAVDLAGLRRAGPRTLAWSLVRLIALPAVAVGAALLLGVSGLPLAIVVLAAATPTATNSVVLARELGGDAAFSANLIAVQTVFALATMPLAWAIFEQISA
ncbi:MAG: AEC family transporter [Pseudomonadota bacterium]